MSTEPRVGDIIKVSTTNGGQVIGRLLGWDGHLNIDVDRLSPRIGTYEISIEPYRIHTLEQVSA